jgi:hypothetical protein
MAKKRRIEKEKRRQDPSALSTITLRGKYDKASTTTDEDPR